MVRLNLDRIRTAVSVIAPIFLNTPQYECDPLSDELGCQVVLKVETLNPVRSFKGRGTETVLTKVAGLDGPRTVICASAGNLGQALAYGGNQRGILTTVVAAITANPLKVERIRSLGATIKLIGDDIEAARIVARELAEQQNAYLLEDSLDIDSCEGAATIGLELVKDPTGFDFVLIALGAGAILATSSHH